MDVKERLSRTIPSFWLEQKEGSTITVMGNTLKISGLGKYEFKFGLEVWADIRFF